MFLDFYRNFGAARLKNHPVGRFPQILRPDESSSARPEPASSPLELPPAALAETLEALFPLVAELVAAHVGGGGGAEGRVAVGGGRGAPQGRHRHARAGAGGLGAWLGKERAGSQINVSRAVTQN